MKHQTPLDTECEFVQVVNKFLVYCSVDWTLDSSTTPFSNEAPPLKRLQNRMEICESKYDWDGVARSVFVFGFSTIVGSHDGNVVSEKWDKEMGRETIWEVFFIDSDHPMTQFNEPTTCYNVLRMFSEFSNRPLQTKMKLQRGSKIMIVLAPVFITVDVGAVLVPKWSESELVRCSSRSRMAVG